MALPRAYPGHAGVKTNKLGLRWVTLEISGSYISFKIFQDLSQAKPNPKIPNPNPGLGGFIFTRKNCRRRRHHVLFEFSGFH